MKRLSHHKDNLTTEPGLTPDPSPVGEGSKNEFPTPTGVGAFLCGNGPGVGGKGGDFAANLKKMRGNYHFFP
jgi:hypothetical protein